MVPGTPALDGVRPAAGRAAGNTTAVAARTSPGRRPFSIKVTPKASAKYSVVTPDLTKVEIATLHPVFGDLLQSSTLKLSKVAVSAAPTLRGRPRPRSARWR